MGVSVPNDPKTTIPPIFRGPVNAALAALIPRLTEAPMRYTGQRVAPMSAIEMLAQSGLAANQVEGRNRIAPTSGTAAFGGANPLAALQPGLGGR